MEKTRKIAWQYAVLAALMIVSACLHLWAYEKEGYSNPYYAAAVSGMLKNPAAFFYGSFDSGLYVTVDKPAFGLWLQALSARVFGVNSFGLLFPSALAGTLCVLLLFLMVRKKWGLTAGILAAGIMAFTPILVALSRTNNLDVLLLFFLLCGAALIQLAAEKQSLPLLLASMAMVGVGFNIKMLQAFLVLPAFLLLYWLPKGRFWRKLWHTLVAVAVLAVISLSWAVAVDRTPPTERPYVGGSETNSVVELALGYNGLTRLLGHSNGQQNRQTPPDGQQDRQIPSGGSQSQPQRQGQPRPEPGAGPQGPGAPSIDQQQPPQQGGSRANGGGVGGESENGTAGVFRLFDQQLAGLSSWFLLPALGAALTGIGFWISRKKMQALTDRQRAQIREIVFWGAWLIPAAVFFSVAGFMHRYYVVMLAPAAAALSAIAITAVWNNRRQAWLVPILVLSALAVQCVIVARSSWQWLLLAMLPAGAVGLFAFFRQKRRAAALLFALALFVAPVAWSVTPVTGTLNAHIPDAGPDADTAAGAQRESLATTALTDYIAANYDGERWALAVPNANIAAPIILATGLPVMAIGGFNGSDSILSLDQLKEYAASGALRYVLISQEQGPNELYAWIRENAAIVTLENRITLYDLSGIG